MKHRLFDLHNFCIHDDSGLALTQFAERSKLQFIALTWQETVGKSLTGGKIKEMNKVAEHFVWLKRLIPGGCRLHVDDHYPKTPCLFKDLVPCAGRMKGCINGPGHMTKMTAMSILKLYNFDSH